MPNIELMINEQAIWKHPFFCHFLAQTKTHTHTHIWVISNYLFSMVDAANWWNIKPTKHKILMSKSSIHPVFSWLLNRGLKSCSWQHFKHQIGARTSHLWLTHITSAHLKQNPTSDQQNEVSLFLYQCSQSTMSTVSDNQQNLHPLSTICCASLTFTVANPGKPGWDILMTPQTRSSPIRLKLGLLWLWWNE